MVPVLMGAIGLAFFAAHIYEVKSDLQRIAQAAADYGAQRCDYRATHAAGSTCAATDHHGTAEMVTYANDHFGGNDFSLDTGACQLGSATNAAVLCPTYNPSPPASPTTNQRLRVRVRYRYDSALAPFLRLIHVDQFLGDLEGRGEASVE
jgi:Flp pilus assembly protein TadG